MRLTAASERSSNGLSVGLDHPSFAFRLRVVFFRHVDSKSQKFARTHRSERRVPRDAAGCAENFNSRLTSERTVAPRIPNHHFPRPQSTARANPRQDGLVFSAGMRAETPRLSPPRLRDADNCALISASTAKLASDGSCGKNRLGQTQFPIYARCLRCKARPAAKPRRRRFSCASGLTHHNVEIVASRPKRSQKLGSNPREESFSRKSWARSGSASPSGVAQPASAWHRKTPAAAMSSEWRAIRARVIEQQRRG